MNDKKVKSLIERALSASANAVCDYSKFRVGAALLTKGGKIFTGCNIENKSLTMVICAERVALYKAVSEGHRDFIAIAVVAAGKNRFCPPCGPCRQLLYEFAPDLNVIMANNKKDYIIKRIDDLLPLAFKI